MIFISSKQCVKALVRKQLVFNYVLLFDGDRTRRISRSEAENDTEERLDGV